ncbi:hypothetical protein B9Z55_010765 [Caenorhabditis nigoni]|uniref:Uncharacterized protein n=1 Tax=Caenorhabditis nigoni TaxID=1611254 RepID=A0A2G5UHV4_9PELO|nr:hypothetical protein B9Z55_010765 [Caenorhabditis nigoni]
MVKNCKKKISTLFETFKFRIFLASRNTCEVRRFQGQFRGLTRFGSRIEMHRFHYGNSKLEVLLSFKELLVRRTVSRIGRDVDRGSRCMDVWQIGGLPGFEEHLRG